MTKQPKILPPPDERPSHLPLTGKWLSGEGAGSWFVIEETRTKLQYRITRLSPGGMIECKGDYITNYSIKLDFPNIICPGKSPTYLNISLY